MSVYARGKARLVPLGAAAMPCWWPDGLLAAVLAAMVILASIAPFSFFLSLTLFSYVSSFLISLSSPSVDSWTSA